MENDIAGSQFTDDVNRGQITQTPSGALKAPKNIILNVAAARSLYQRVRSQHLKRIMLYSEIEGLIAGNPPYSPSDLDKYHINYIANFNPMDARAVYEKVGLAYWNLLNQTEIFCKITIVGMGNEEAEASDVKKWSDIMSYELDKVIRLWPGFVTNMNVLSAQLVKFGISPVLWPDERDWRFRTIDTAKFFVADQAQTDIERLTYACVETDFTAQYLFEVYETFKDKENSPWDIDALEQLLLWVANTSYKQNTNFTDLLEVQRRVQNGDLSMDAIYTDNIPLVSLFYTEYDETITQYMFHPTYPDALSFLFKAEKQYDSLQEAVVIFTASPGESTIHSNRGVGHKMYSTMQAVMQIDCSIADMAKMSSTPLIQGVATGASDFEAIRFIPGVPTNIGTAQFVQNQLGANINQLVGASQYFTAKVQNNSANGGDDPSYPDSAQGSLAPSEARAKSFKEFGILKNNIAHFYNQLDTVIRNMFRRIYFCSREKPGYDYVEEWKQACIRKGVPPILFDMKDKNKITGLPRHLEIRASRVAGDGSTLARIMGLQELYPIASSFGTRGQYNFNREIILAAVGPEYVEPFLSDSGVPDETAGGASLAGVENSVMELNKSPIFSMDNEHRSHIVTHLALASNVMLRISKNEMSPVEADPIFSVLIPHIEDHYAALGRSPLQQQFIAQIKGPVNQVAEYARLNSKNATAMIKAEIMRKQKEQEAQQQVMSDAERKDFQAQRDEGRKDFKIQQQVERAKQANQTRGEVMKERVRSEAQIKSEKNIMDTQVAREKVLQDASIEELKAMLDAKQGNTPSMNDNK